MGKPHPVGRRFRTYRRPAPLGRGITGEFGRKKGGAFDQRIYIEWHVQIRTIDVVVLKPLLLKGLSVLLGRGWIRLLFPPFGGKTIAH